MTVRPIIIGDDAEFCRLCRCFYDSGATKRGYDRENAMRTFHQLITNHENLFGYFIIEESTGSVAGYALITSYWCNEEAGNVLILDELFVDPAFRHRGFGTRFLQWLEQEFRGLAAQVTLEVLSTNLPARELYYKEGFCEDGFVTMTKDLS